jgi:ribosomal protein S18 acetylase RimI-like enzyme
MLAVSAARCAIGRRRSEGIGMADRIEPEAYGAARDASRGPGARMVVTLMAGAGPRLRAIRLRALSDAPDAFGSTLAEAERWDDARWEQQVVALPTFVWHEHGADLGMVRGAPHDGDPEAGYLISLWVAPEARGRGVGAALVRAVVAWARAKGLRRLVLDVGARNQAAQALYQRLGFAVSGVTGTLPAPRERVCEIEMVLELERA